MKIKQLWILFLPLLIQAAPFTIGDKVWIDSNEDWEQNSNEIGFKDATIELYNASNVKIKTTKTDNNGIYKFTGLNEGEYTVKILQPTNMQIITQSAINLWLESNRTDIDFGIAPPAQTYSIGDRVWNDLDEDWEQDLGEPGYANVSVELYNATGTKLKTTTTDSNGNYQFSGLLEGGYIVKVIVPNTATAVTLTSTELWLEQNLNNIDFGILKTGTIADRDAIIPIDSNLMLGGEDKILYYADAAPSENGLNRVIRVDYKNWTFSAMGLNGINPHSVDRVGASDKFYVRTKNSSSIDVINFKTNSIKTVNLGQLKPRSGGAVNLKYNISVISSTNAPASSIIDHNTDNIITVLGDPDSISSGANAMGSGHPVWINENYLALLNTLEMVIEFYRVEKLNNNLKFTLVDWVHFDVGIHTIARVREPKNSEDLITFYALEEANAALGLPTPRIHEIKFNAQNETLDVKRAVLLSQSTTPINGIAANLHHGGTSPDGKYLVIPTYDKKVYFINRTTMKVDKILPAGLGAGHIEFSKQENLAILTNHYDENVTIIDMSNLTVKANIDISTTHFNPTTKRILQPHFGHVSKDGRYYYTFATQDGDFVEIDLRTLQVTRKLHVGGAPEQSHS